MDMTNLTRDFDPKTIFQVSAALPIVEIKNVKSHMGDDVFRIFRQTTTNVRNINTQHEKEQTHLLKSSYLEKNQLYKELAGIGVLKDNPSMQRRKTLLTQTMGNIYMQELAKLREVNKTSHLDARVAHGRGARKQPEELLSARAVEEYEKSKMIVKKMKRCECCKSMAVRIKEHYQRKIEEEERLEAEQRELEGVLRTTNISADAEKKYGNANNRSKSNDRNVRKTSKGNRTVKVQTKNPKEEICDEQQQTASNRNTQSSLETTNKQQVYGTQETHLKTNSSTEESTQSHSLQGHVSSPGRSSPFVRSQTCPALLGSPNRSVVPLRRQKIHVKFPAPAKIKVKLEGQAWQKHLVRLQQPKSALPSTHSTVKAYRSLQTTVDVTTAYLRFKRNLSKTRGGKIQEEILDKETENSEDEREDSKDNEDSEHVTQEQEFIEDLEKTEDISTETVRVRAKTFPHLDSEAELVEKDLDRGSFKIEEEFPPRGRRINTDLQDKDDGFERKEGNSLPGRPRKMPSRWDFLKLNT